MNEHPPTRTATRLLPYVLALIGYAWFLLQERRIAGEWGFSLDDAWIHAVFARNLIAGNGFSFNPGVPVNGSTSVLWTLLMGLPMLLGINLIAGTKLIGVALHFGCIALTGRILRLLSGPRAALTGMILVAITPRMLWGGLSGMEVNLYALIALAGLYAYTRARLAPRPPGAGAAVCWGAALWVRPETPVMLALFELEALLDRRTRAWGPLIVRALIVLAFAAVFVAFQYQVGGRPLPMTFYAKADTISPLHALTGGDLGALKELLINRPAYALTRTWGAIAWRDCALCLPLILMGTIAIWRRRSQWRLWALPASTIVFPLAVVMVGGEGVGQYQRYLFFLSPYFMILAALGLEEALERLQTRGWLARPRTLAALVLGGKLLFMLLDFLFQRFVANAYNHTIFGGGALFGLAIAAVLALLLMLMALGRTRPLTRSLARQSARVLLVGAMLGGLLAGGIMHGWNVQNINAMQVAYGRWVARELPKDAVVAVNDIGAIRWFGGRRIVDLKGLVSPEVHPFVFEHIDEYESQSDAAWAFMRQAAPRPTHLILLPRWYPRMELRYGDYLEPLHTIELEMNTICGGAQMKAWRIRWERLDAVQE